MRGLHNPRNLNLSGFTLVELVMVLVILAILATAALNMVEFQVDQTRFELTQQTVANFDDALLAEKRLPDGTTVFTGFVADIGRPPKATIGLTAEELWNAALFPQDADVELDWRFRFRKADSMSRIHGLTDAETDADGDGIWFDPDITIASGWRGPYLSLPAGAATLTDGWGTEMTGNHLRLSGSVPLTMASQEIFGIQSYGRSNEIDGATTPTDYERDIPTATTGIRYSAATLTPPITGTVTIQQPSVPEDNVVVQIYYPYQDNLSKIAVERAAENSTVGRDEISVVSSTATSTTFRFTFLAEPVDPIAPLELPFGVGQRVVRAYYNSSTAITDATDLSTLSKSPPTSFTVSLTEPHLDIP